MNLPLIDKEDCIAHSLVVKTEPGTGEEGEGDSESSGAETREEVLDDDRDHSHAQPSEYLRKRAENIAENQRIMEELKKQFPTSEEMFPKTTAKKAVLRKGKKASIERSDTAPRRESQRQKDKQTWVVLSLL